MKTLLESSLSNNIHAKILPNRKTIFQMSGVFLGVFGGILLFSAIVQGAFATILHFDGFFDMIIIFLELMAYGLMCRS